MGSFWLLFKITSSAMFEIFLLGLCGFIATRKKFINEEGLRLLSRLVVEITLPLFIFSQFIQRFSFSLYKNWLIFPFLSILISAAGLAAGFLFLKVFPVVKDEHQRREFLSLLMFQNSGYLPLILVSTFLPDTAAGILYIYIFLFLLGFNLTIWSFGVWFLKGESIKNFELGSLFSPPVVATLISLVIVLVRLDRIMPPAIVNTADLLGRCTLPLAMLVVGGNLALIPITKEINIRAITGVVALKLFALPVIAVAAALMLRLEVWLGLLLVLEAIVPSATNLSVISRHYQLEDRLTNQGIFYTHLVSLVTIPVFLSFYQVFAF